MDQLPSGNAPSGPADRSAYPGIHAILFALFGRDEALDRGAMRAQIHYCESVGIDGLAVLGLATEVAKLDPSERRAIIEWTAQDKSPGTPLAVTIAGNSVAEQVALLQFAEGCGADWFILQPPLCGTYPPSVYIDFFARVAEKTERPVAIQNAPAYLGRSLSSGDIGTLRRHCPNLTHVKAEDDALAFRRLAEQAPGMTLLNGRGGLEMPEVLEAGAAGFVLAPDIIEPAVQLHAAWLAGDRDRAWDIYRRHLPHIVFAMRSLEHLVVYGKRILAARIGLEVHDRAPSLPLDPFALERASRFAGGGDAASGTE